MNCEKKILGGWELMLIREWGGGVEIVYRREIRVQEKQGLV